MKRGIGLIVLAAVVIGVGGLVRAQEDGRGKGASITAKTERAGDARTERVKAPDLRQVRRPDDVGPGVPPAGMVRDGIQERQGRMFQEQIAAKRQEFDTYAAELKAIKKMALEEKAKKTAAYIDKLLARKQSELDAEIKATEDRMKGVQERMQKMMEERARRMEQQRRPEALPEGLKMLEKPAGVEKPAEKAAEKVGGERK